MKKRLYIIINLILLILINISCNKEPNEIFEKEINNKLSDMPPFPYEVYEKWEEVEKPLSIEAEKALNSNKMIKEKELIEEKEHQYQTNIGYSFSLIQEWLKGIDIENKLIEIKDISPLNKSDLNNLDPIIKEEIEERFLLFKEINEELVNWIEFIK